MLLNGFNHVAIILTKDTQRFVDFYRDVFGAEVDGFQDMGGEGRLTFVRVGEQAEINLFELNGSTEPERQTPMFGRGRIDHLGLQADSLEAFETIRQRLIDRGAADEFVTDFGPILSLFFVDPDGLEGEVAAYAAAPPPTTAPARARATRDFRSRDVSLIHLL